MSHLARFVTSIAIVRSLLLLVAGHAAAHRDVAFLVHHIAISNRPVAVFTGSAGVGVDAMREEHEARRLIDTLPANFLLFCRGFRQRLNMGRIGFNHPMASHTRRDFGDAHHLARIRIGVTILTL